MEQQLSAPLTDKIDIPLAQLCNGGRGFAPSERVPVLIKFKGDSLDEVVNRLNDAGGSVRRVLDFVDGIAAWVPLSSIERLALDNAISFLELEQHFSVA